MAYNEEDMDEKPEVSSTPDKSNLIRTFAKDAASLGQAVPKEFTPAPTPKKKPAPKPVEKKKPLEEVLPTTVRKTKEDPSFVPVPAPQIEETKKEFKPSPMPFSVPLPAPMSRSEQLATPLPTPPPAPEPLSPIHTYKTDFAENIDTKKASTFSVLATQLDAGTTVSPKTLVKEKKAFPLTPVLLGIVLLLAGGGGVWYAYTSTFSSSPSIPVFSVPTLVFADDRKELEGPDFSGALVSALADSLEEGKIRVLYSATASSTASGMLHIPNEGIVLIKELNLNTPSLLLRNIEGISTTGMIHSEGETSPFFVLRTSSYERTFSAMLSWETTIAQDLAWMYPSEKGAVSPIATGTPATSTPVQTLSPFTPTFKDKVVGNYNIRVLTDRNGGAILCYGYKDKQTLIIAKSPEIFVLLAGRLVETK